MTTTNDSVTDKLEQTADAVEQAAAGYAPADEERPLAGYATLVGVYGAGAAAFLTALKAANKKVPDGIPLTDLLLLGVGTHKLSWILAKDRVTSFLRAPLTRYQGSLNSSDVKESVRGHGLRLAAGELAICPYCMGQWVASGMLAAYALSPSRAKFIASIFAAVTISDQLHVHYANQRA
jgi:hypothetical protein